MADLTTSRAPVIRVTKTTKTYGDVTGVRDISLEVQPGDIFGFLGPNGAGKTTTIRLLLDLLRPTAGRIEIFGKDVSRNSYEIRKRCGYLPSNFSAYMNLDGMEYLRLCADIRQASREPDRKMLDRFELSDINLRRKIKYLSHGTLQKLGIIQAFSHEPELAILDEPTTGLDPLMQEEFYRLMNELHDKGQTIFISSHNLAEVEKICNSLAILKEGRITWSGPIESLRKKMFRTLKFTLHHAIDEISLPGAGLIRQNGLSYEYSVHGAMADLLPVLARLPIDELFIPEPGLDDVFISYYKDPQHD